MNTYAHRTAARYPAAKVPRQFFKGFRPMVLRGLDIIVSALAICFLAPVFALLAVVPIRDDSLGLSQLPQLFLVFAGEMSLFDGGTR